MAEPKRASSREALLRMIRGLRWEMDSIRRALERAEERADSLLQNLIAIEKFLARDCDGSWDSKTLQPLPKDSFSATDILMGDAERGADSLEMKPLSNGSAIVRVNGRQGFRLPPSLARLLEFAASDSHDGGGPLVGWKSYAAVADYLQEKLGRPFRKHTIHQLVARLRVSLAVGGGANPYYVQTDSKLGIRFALRRTSPGVSATNPM